nr:copia protein [Tanacetum cinerariifolium]
KPSSFLIFRSFSSEEEVFLGVLVKGGKTRIVEENLHIRFSKNTPNVVGSRPDWLFDIDALKRTMNYKPIVAGTQSNGFADPNISYDDEFKPSSDVGKKVDEDPSKGIECNDQEKQNSVNNTNNVNTLSSTVNAAKTNEVNEDNELLFDLEILLWKMNKKDERGIVIRNKARLVSQGDTQEEGIDYDEVFTHVARIEAIRLFLAYASFKDFVVYQMDVKSAFLYEKIEEEVYVNHQDLKIQTFLIEYTRLKMQCIDYIKLLEHVCACARYQVNIKVSHLHVVKRIFRYLKGQPKIGLWYPKDSSFDLVAYTDSAYAGASLYRESTTGGCQFLGCRLISW